MAMSLWTAIVRRPEHRLGNWNAKSNYSVWQLATLTVFAEGGSGGNQGAIKCKENEFRIVLQIERLHDVVLVEHGRFLADLENVGDFPHRTAFGK